MTRKNRPGQGRKSIFGSKANGTRIQGVLSRIGAEAFERARMQLAILAGLDAATISDADVAEFAVRGTKETRAVLRGKQAAK